MKIKSKAEQNAGNVEQAIVEDGAALTKAFEGANRVFSRSPLVENPVELGTDKTDRPLNSCERDEDSNRKAET